MAGRCVSEQLDRAENRQARLQFALLKTTVSAGANGATSSDIRPTARTKNASGTTTRFARSETGVIK